jgi:hypothetical protein
MSLVERTRGHLKRVDLDTTHYGELTLVFLEGVASRSPHGSAMCDKPFATMSRVRIGWTSPRLGCRPREIGCIYKKCVLMVNGPRRSPSLNMKKNNMDSR